MNDIFVIFLAYMSSRQDNFVPPSRFFIFWSYFVENLMFILLGLY
jgi:hypothetical protein